MGNKRKIGWISAGALVVANMIGTGVFTTLGLQLNVLSNTWTILSLWILGGMIALFGAFSYAELGTRHPHSGGEYHFLTKMYNSFLGYLSGWVSLTVGFATSIALSAMAMGNYLAPLVSFPSLWLAIISIIGLSLIHSFSIRQSSFFQNIFTLLKILLILGLIIVSFIQSGTPNALDFSSSWQDEISTSGYAIALVYVMYAFSGWNAAAYIVDEIDTPVKNLPRALVGGTVLVSLLFIFLQLAFLNQATIAQLQNKIEVGQVVADLMFGAQGGRIVSTLIALLLVAGISAMIWVGPRVTHAMANEHQIWKFFAKDNNRGIPVRAIWLQAVISLAMVLTSSFEQILLYSGFILQLFTTLTVAGLLFERRKANRHKIYRSPGYPYIQIIFLIFSIWLLAFLLYDKPRESLLGLFNILAGALSYWWNKRYHPEPPAAEKPKKKVVKVG
ncbi:MAG: amino acid permease [Saprospiraceae bacterium]|nr:MAG: amino acid permease [Saprospiraceae bacterium]